MVPGGIFLVDRMDNRPSIIEVNNTKRKTIDFLNK